MKTRVVEHAQVFNSKKWKNIKSNSEDDFMISTKIVEVRYDIGFIPDSKNDYSRHLNGTPLNW